MFCDDCGRKCVPPVGPETSRILLVGDSPTYYDIKDGRPWTGPGGDVLRAELRLAGISYDQCRVVNMWLHAKSPKDCPGHLGIVLAEMKGRHVLLMGAEAVTHFTSENVSDISGLRVDQMPHAKNMLPKSAGITYAMFNPAIATHESLGEVRLAIQKFADAVKEAEDEVE